MHGETQRHLDHGAIDFWKTATRFARKAILRHQTEYGIKLVSVAAGALKTERRIEI